MCIFCKIAAKEVETNLIYEDEDIVAFYDANPLSKHHTLVVPKKHTKNIYDTPASTLNKLISVTQYLVKKYEEDYQIKDFNLLANNNELAGQTVDHIHFHIIPRYKNDKISQQLKNKELN